MEEMNLPRVRDAALSFAVDGYPTTYLSDDDLHAARRGWGDGRLNPKGVSFRHSRSKSKPWEASISFMGKNRGLGSYATPDQAARAYDCAARIAYAGLPLESLREKLNFPDHLVYPPEACRKGLSKIQEDLMGAEEAAVVLQDISCVAPAPDPAAATPRARQTGARSAANGAAGKHADGAGGAGAAPGADDGDALPDPEDAAAFEETLEAFLALRCGPERDEEAANAAEDGPPGACATAKAQAERAGPASARPGSRGEGATAGPEGEAEGAAEAQEAAQDPEQEPEQDEVPSHGFLGVPEWLEEHQLATTDEGFLAWEMEMPHSNISGRGRSAGEDARQAQRIDARLDELEREAELAADNPDPDAPYVPRWGDGGAAAQQQHAGTAGRVWKGLYHRPSKNRPWEASISFLGRNRGLGSYVSPEEGARAFDAAARLILQGLPPEDMGARLNYPHREFPAPERAVAGIERIRADMDAEGISVRDAHLYAVRGKAGMRRPQGAAPAPEDEEDGEEEAEREAERLPARPRKPGEWGGSGKRRAYAPLPARMGQGFWAEEAMRGYPAEGSASEGSDGEEPSDRAVARWGECCLPEDSWGSILANDAGFREVTSAPQASGAAALGGVQLRAPPGPLAPPPPLPLPPPVRPPPPAPGPSGLAPLVLPPGTLVGNRYHTYCMVCHEKGGDGLVCENDLDLCPCTVCWGCLGIDSLEANFIDFFYCPSCVDRRGLQGRHRDDASTLPYDLERLRVAWMRAKEEHDLLQKQHAAETGGVAQVWGAPLPTAFAIAPSGCADGRAAAGASTGAAKSERARKRARSRSGAGARGEGRRSWGRKQAWDAGRAAGADGAAGAQARRGGRGCRRGAACGRDRGGRRDLRAGAARTGRQRGAPAAGEAGARRAEGGGEGAASAGRRGAAPRALHRAGRQPCRRAARGAGWASGVE
ncbi:unnamed protein product [Pedinophyceae sp. YPF-701]|nr:unnamed protein product [Pedinophyceae sp. YPF-701]